MRLDVSKALAAEGEEVPFAGEVLLEETEVLGEAVSFPAPARLQGMYASVGEAIHLRGEMTFCAMSRCGLCLKDAEKEFTVPFDATFLLKPDAEDPDAYRYDGAWLNPADMARDAAQLALPMKWRCGPGCKGLCPVCGTDLNTLTCSCRMESENKHPFSALQTLLTEDESEV